MGKYSWHSSTAMLENQRVYCTTGVSGYQPLAKNCFAVAAQILAGLSLGRHVGSHEYGLMTATNTPSNIYQHPPPNQSINKSIKSSPNQNTIKITIKPTSKHKNKWNRPNQSIKSVNQYINKSVHPKKQINQLYNVHHHLHRRHPHCNPHPPYHHRPPHSRRLLHLHHHHRHWQSHCTVMVVVAIIFIVIIVVSPGQKNATTQCIRISFPVDWAAHFAAKGGPVLGQYWAN